MDEALREMYDELSWIEHQIRINIHAPYKKDFYQEMYARRREIARDIENYKKKYGVKEDNHDHGRPNPSSTS